MERIAKLVLSAEAAGIENNDVTIESVANTRTKRNVFGYTPAELRSKYGDNWRTRHIEVGGKQIPIHNTVVTGGRRIPLLKAMLTTACERDCLYCPFRAGRNFKRVRFSPEELATTFHSIHFAGKAEGLFLSGGIINGGSNSQDQLLDVAHILRHKLHYRGYLHLKIMPGSERDQILQAMQLADRISVNLEAPNQSRLARLAPSKDFYNEMFLPLSWIEEIRKNGSSKRGWDGSWPSSTTQFVVGAAGESDLEILSTVAHLNNDFGLSRAYFEAFNPIPETPLENLPAENPLRQHRLYQASFLMTQYRFDVEDLPFSENGQLPLERDPKLAYAQKALVDTPIEVNLADRNVLLRVPGIGPRGATLILENRSHNRFRSLRDLQNIGIITKRAAPYILLDGQRPPQQMKLL